MLSKAYEYWNAGPVILTKQDDNYDRLVQSSKHIGADLPQEDYAELLLFSPLDGWPRYADLRSRFYHVQPSPIFNGFYECTCFEGVKHNVCKHAVALMCNDGLADYPAEVTELPLGQKRKRGRKRRATRALVID